MDCWEKRKKKGYFFMTGDEVAFYSLSGWEVKKVIGDDIEKEIRIPRGEAKAFELGRLAPTGQVVKLEILVASTLAALETTLLLAPYILRSNQFLRVASMLRKPWTPVSLFLLRF